MGVDFTPSLIGYSGVGAFYFWCQRVLPLVYDDSLSYYELLCKVVKYINNLISDVSVCEENIGSLLNAYTQLQDYVNHYFDNLDYQAMVNNKLDAMVQDGTLSALIAAYVDPALADLETFKTEIQGTVDTLESDVRVAEADVDNVEDRMDALVASLNIDNLQTVLWTGTGKISGTTYVLEESVAGYDFLDIYTYNHEKCSIHTIPVDANELYVIRDFNISDYAVGGSSTPVIEGGEFEVSFNATTMTIANHSWYLYDATNSSTPTGGNVSAETTAGQLEIAGWITKVVGRKMTTNAEVEDIRTGYDGTEYLSAGTAVRTQVGDLNRDLNNMISVMCYTETVDTSDYDDTRNNINPSNQYSVLSSSSTQRNKFIPIPDNVVEVTLIPDFPEAYTGRFVFAFVGADTFEVGETPNFVYPTADGRAEIYQVDMAESYTFKVSSAAKTLFVLSKYQGNDIVPTVKFTYFPLYMADDGDSF